MRSVSVAPGLGRVRRNGRRRVKCSSEREGNSRRVTFGCRKAIVAWCMQTGCPTSRRCNVVLLMLLPSVAGQTATATSGRCERLVGGQGWRVPIARSQRGWKGRRCGDAAGKVGKKPTPARPPPPAMFSRSAGGWRCLRHGRSAPGPGSPARRASPGHTAVRRAAASLPPVRRSRQPR